jgi:hypothetical protein
LHVRCIVVYTYFILEHRPRKLGAGLVQRVSIEHVLFALIVRAAYLYLVSNDYKRAAGWSIMSSCARHDGF